MSITLYIFTLSLVLFYATHQSLYVMMNKYTSIYFKVFSFIILLAVFYLSINYTTFLPFLGETAIPLSAFKDVTSKKETDNAYRIYINAPDGTRVVYWASNSSQLVIPNPKDAYEKSPNVGIAEVRNNMVTFYTTCPSSYKVSMGRIIKPHIHYRVAKSNGLLGAVKTVKVECT